MQSINVLVTFGAGIATFFAPCTFTALPSFISYLAVSISGGREDAITQKGAPKVNILASTLAYLLGFLSIFTLLGLAATQLGTFLHTQKTTFKIIGGVLIMLCGLFMLVGEYIPPLRNFFISRTLSIKTIRSPFFPFLIGVTNAFAWTPCIGPILGFILLLASSSINFYSGGILLFAYGLGTTIPFLLLALFFDLIKDKLHKLNKLSFYIYKVSAFTIFILGFAYMIGFEQDLFGFLYRIFVNLGYTPM